MTTLNSSNNSNVSFGSIYLKGNKDVAKNALGLLPKRVQKNLATNNEYGLVVKADKNRDNTDKVTFQFVREKDGKPVKTMKQQTYNLENGVESLKNQKFAQFVGSIKKALFGKEEVAAKGNKELVG